MAYIDPILYINTLKGTNKTHLKHLLSLIDDGATIPFIARYRKEMTGAMDEVQIGELYDLYKAYKELEQRKQFVLDAIEQQGKLTPSLKDSITNAYALQEVEDLYLPYKQKRQTRATKAKALGLEPLALALFKDHVSDPEAMAHRFLNDKVENIEQALQGARDIIAEWISEDTVARNRSRQNMERELFIVSKVVKGKEEEGEKFRDYFDWREPLKRIPSHRLLALKRGENEGFLRVSLVTDDNQVLSSLEKLFVSGNRVVAHELELAVRDSYKRLLFPQLETEFLSSSKEKADEAAIQIFMENLRQLLLAPPLGNKRILAIDPGFRTGCKVVCLSETGQLLHNETIYPHPPKSDVKGACTKINQMVESYKIDAIAIGNGTAGRETEQFIQKIRFNKDIQVFVVSESGASIYSASKIARDEFPEYDVTVRGAVSIGRRLMDPLAELVKIEPKSIGVGQYQHDVDQVLLKQSLERVVESCVNAVGVNVNTASKYLLSYVSGLGTTLAENVANYIKENGAFKNRKELMKVKRMGPKSYEQCAGFLRIADSDNPLDNSAVHPESYKTVELMAKDLGVHVTDLIGNSALCDQIKISNYIQYGENTVRDIIDELRKPGRDPRSTVKIFSFDQRIHTIEDLEEGMIVPGIVTNLTNFGAFIDIGIKQDGLVHISEIANRFITSPTEALSLNEHVSVKVIGVDKPRKRISLSIRQATQEKNK